MQPQLNSAHVPIYVDDPLHEDLDSLDPGTEYHVIGLATMHYTQGGERGSNPYPIGTMAAELYNKTMAELFDAEQLTENFPENFDEF